MKNTPFKIFAAFLTLFLSVFVGLSSCSDSANGSGELVNIDSWRVDSSNDSGLSYPANWDERDDLMKTEPVDLKLLQVQRGTQTELEGLLLKGNVDLSQSTIEYFTAKPSEVSAENLLPPEAEPLAVVDFNPVGELPIEMRKPTIYVMFNHPMVPLAKLGEPITSTPLLNLDPPVKGVFRWYGTRVLSFEPDQVLVNHPRYKVTVDPNISSLGGRKLEKPFSFEFYTETVKMVNFYPGNNPNEYYNTYDVPTKVARFMIVEFNQDIDPDHIKSFLKVQAGSRSVGFKVSRPAYSDNLETRSPRGLLVTLDQEPPENTKVEVILSDKASPKPGYPERKDPQSNSLQTVLPFRSTYLSSSSWDIPRSNIPKAIPVYFQFSHPLDPAVEKLKFAVKLDGTAAQPVEQKVYGTTLRITLEGTKPGQEIRVLPPSAGVKDIYGRPLTNPKTELQTHLAEPWPYLSFPSWNFNHLEAAFPPQFIWEARNIEFMKLGLEGKPSYFASMPTKPVQKEIDVQGWEANKVRYSLEDLKPYLNDKGFGTVFGAFSARQEKRFSRRKAGDTGMDYADEFAIQVTDLGITTRFAYNRVLVWVNSLSKGTPVAGAQVRIFNNAGTEKTAQTDGAGLAIITLSPGEIQNFNGSANKKYFAMSASKGDDLAEIRVQNTHNTWNETTYGQTSPFHAEESIHRIFIFTDRGLYKGGEELALRGIHWIQDPQGFRPYQGEIQLNLNDSRSGEPLWSYKGKSSFSGGFAQRFTLPKDLEPGSYYISYGPVKESDFSSGVSFSVANFRRLNFQVLSTVADRLFFEGDEVGVDVKASYLAGGSMPGADYTYYWTRRPVSFTPPGNQWSGLAFGPGLWEGDHTLDSGTGTLSGAGAARVTTKTAGQNADGSAYRYALETTVEDVDRQAVASNASVTVHPASFYIGARFGSGSTDGWWSRFVATGQNVDLKAHLVDPRGQAFAEALPLTMKIIQGQYKMTQQQGVYGQVNSYWEYVEEEIRSETLRTNGAGEAALSFQVKEAGNYLLTLEGQDSQGRQTRTNLRFYATGSGWVRRATESPSDIAMKVDKEIYQVGETARILVQSPIADGKYLMTIEREGLFEEKIIEIKGSQNLIEIPVKKEYLPVFYVALTSFTKREEAPKDYFEPDLGRPRSLFGIAGIRVSTKPIEMDVKVLPLKGAYKPGEVAEVAIQVTQNGKPVANAEVTLLAVDRGVLDLIAYHVPNPIDFFYDPYNFPLGVHGDDSRRLLLKPVTFDTRSLVGGDGEKLEERKDFNPLALFEPFVSTDANGTAKVKFKLPDTLTTYRVTAVALRENRLGYQEEELYVRNPINVRTALPRRMRNRDTAAAGVVLTNLTRETQKVEVTVESTILEISGPKTKSIEIPSGGVYELPFVLVAKEPGEGTISFIIKSPVINEKLTEPMVVERPLVKEAFTTVGSIANTESKAQEGLVLASRIAPGYGNLTIKASSTLRPYVEPALSRLINQWTYYEWYHYSNLTSVFAHIYEKNRPDLVQRIFKDLQSRQLDGGGIYTGSWTYSPYLPDPYISLLTAHALHFASSRQVVLSLAPNKNRLLGYLESLKETDFSPYFRAYLTYVLALHGRADAARFARMEQLEDSVGLGGYGLMAQAYLAGKDEASARRVYQRSKNFVLMGTQKVDVKETYEATDYWSSLLGEMALLLKNAVDLKEDRGLILRIAGSLNRSERYWQTRNDDLWTLLAFIPILDSEGTQRGQGQFSILVDNKALGEFKLDGAKPQDEKVLPFFEEPLKAMPRDKVLPLDFTKTGDTTFYYTTILRYALPNETATARDEGIGVFTKYETLDGKAVQNDGLKLGETYRVRVNLSSSKRRQRLELQVPIPSGAEIVDPSFVTTGRFATSGGSNSEEWTRETVYGDTQSFSGEGEGYYEDYDWYWYWYTPDTFAMDNMMVYRWRDFYAGQRDISFLIRITTPGVYPTPPVSASLEFEPEVFGRSEGRLFVIQP